MRFLGPSDRGGVCGSAGAQTVRDDEKYFLGFPLLKEYWERDVLFIIDGKVI